MRPLHRRIEEACLNGWPALRQIVSGGLLLRFSDGYTRRANSVNAIGPLIGDAHEAIALCESAYRHQNLPTIFRLSSTWDVGLGLALDRAGYGPPEDETIVLGGEIIDRPSSDRAIVTALPSEAWLEALARIQGQTDEIRDTHRRILGTLAVPAAFASVTTEGTIASVCFGAVHDGIVCLNSVATDSRFRRRGLARIAIEAVLAWAKTEAGATQACIPVVADNSPAVALYRGLGFDQEHLRYHYRRRSHEPRDRRDHDAERCSA